MKTDYSSDTGSLFNHCYPIRFKSPNEGASDEPVTASELSIDI